jgi:superfamily II DNA or RNA helicase
VLLFTCNQQQVKRQPEHTYYSKNKAIHENLVKFNTWDMQLLACVAQFSEGINIANLRVSIIWHILGNERRTTQRIVRLLRLNPDEAVIVHLLIY